MNPLIGYGLISGIGSLGASLFNQFSGQSMSKDLMDYQYKLQQQAIDAQNLYNSPKEQMKRLAEAQLSPNLVYGSGVDGNQSSAASPSLVNKRGEMENFLGSGVNAFMQAQQLDLQRSNFRVQADEAKSRMNLNEAKTLQTLLDNDFNSATLKTRIEEKAQDLVNKKLQGEKIAQERSNLLSVANKMQEEIKLIEARTGLTKEQAATELVKQSFMRSNIALNDAKIQQIAHYIAYLDSGKALRDLEHDIKDAEWSAGDELTKWFEDHPGWEMTNEVVDLIVDKLNRAFGGRGQTRRKRKK